MLITTIHGEMDESQLTKREGVAVDNDHERTTFVEYYLGEELVHRSVHVTLKESPSIISAVEGFGQS